MEFLEDTEEAFLRAVITDVDPSAPQFKLAPTYTLYLAARYRASTHYRPELQPTERAHRLTVMLANIALMIQGVIQVKYFVFLFSSKFNCIKKKKIVQVYICLIQFKNIYTCVANLV